MSTRPTIAHQPALDGVRALAVVAVLLFHGEVAGFGGGYLGVSVFFTLSGYLITSLLLHEHARTGRIDLPTFYGRRLRRLLPASALCLGAIVVLAAATDLFDGVSALRSHVLGSLLQVANWVFLAGDGSYQDLLARTTGTSSPLEHFWSLAIEEQFYWVWPPTMALVLSRSARRRTRVWVIGSITAASLIAAPVIAQVWGPDAAYWATPARIGEILVGAFLAVVLADRTVAARWHVLAPAALIGLGIAVVLFPSSGGPAYEGALPLVALVSGALLLGLQAPGPVRDALSLEPLVALGRISYGVYLFHWPIYLVLDADRTGLDGWALLAVRLLVTLAISQLSYQFYERPIRLAPRFGPTLTFGGSAVATAGVCVAAVAMVPTGLGDYWVTDEATAAAAAIEIDDEPLEALVAPDPTAVPGATVPPATQPGRSLLTVPAREASDAPANSSAATTAPGVTADAASETGFGATTGGTASTTVPPLPELSRPVRIVVAGDSTAAALGSGVVAWAAANPELAQAELVTAPGCGFVTGGEQRVGDTVEAIEGCHNWVERFLYPAVDRLEPDVVMVMVTSWDLIDRRWDTEELLAPTDADYAARIERDYAALIEGLGAAGTGRVALVRHPIPDVWWLPEVDAQEDPVRHQVIYDTYERLAASNPAVVAVVALDGWMVATDIDRDVSVRPDGIHVDPDAATAITNDFLGERLIRAALGLDAA
jgi:peptidoglycan/LPS O-acetylase OafA/YrhL